jgi:hypothetical protein
MTLARCALLLLCSSTALAQSPAAETLFREGRSLLKQGMLQDACDKFEASEMLEPSVGTLLNLGDCRERLGKLATAWAAFRKAEALARQSNQDGKREAEAKMRATRLEPQLPTLAIITAKQPPGLVIQRNGERVEGGVLGTSVPVDPGHYRIVAEAPGYKRYEIDLALRVGSKRQITIPPLQPVEMPKPDKVVEHVPAPPPPPPPPHLVAHVAHHDPGMWTTSREVSIAVMAAGAGAFGAGAYFGLHSQDLEDRSNKLCPTATCSDPTGLKLNDEAKTAATRANVLYVLGGAAATAGVVLWFVGGPEKHPVLTPDVNPTTVGAHVSGRF